jgi:hypothetical protein
LARDYLAIMASSVSSERAFSQGGLTITKRHNRLKGNIVEALQCLKCAIRHDLLFRNAAPSSILEAKLDEAGKCNDDDDVDTSELDDKGFDNMLIEEDGDNLAIQLYSD